MYCRMIDLRESLLHIAAIYEMETNAHGGRSLARIATIVLNRGAFFDRLRTGKTCTLNSFEAAISWFEDPQNWPDGSIPDLAKRRLDMLASGTAFQLYGRA